MNDDAWASASAVVTICYHAERQLSRQMQAYQHLVKQMQSLMWGWLSLDYLVASL